MTILLFPGRHLLQTAFQEQYLRAVVQAPLDRLKFLPGSQLQVSAPIDTIVFAVTSANHQFTRYNPIPFHIRAIGIGGICLLEFCRLEGSSTPSRPLPFPPTNIVLIAKKPLVATTNESAPSTDSYADASSDLAWIVEQ